MKNKQIKWLNFKHLIRYSVICMVATSVQLHAQVPDPNQGLRASWMRGAWGALWLPESNFNGNIEGVRIDDFLLQIKDLKTIDYIQVGLTSPNIYSPVHTAPHSIIESLWQGETDTNGKPVNLVVPREANDDPFLNWLKAIKAAGLRTEVYVNSYNLLDRIPESIPDDFPEVTARWKEYCDTNAKTQAFINSQSYHKNGVNDDRRPYMFCYAEFILKEYAVRYGDLIDAWCFDSADNVMETECGDNPDSDDVTQQRVYQAFADAVHAGNPNAAVAFNNSVGRLAAPFATATLFDDYSFGHPFGGAGNMVEGTLYDRNFAICEFMSANEGLSFLNDSRSWNDNVVGHFFPKQSTTSWNSGAVPCLTDEQFVEWNSTGVIDGGAITWGTPLVIVNLNNKAPNLTLQPYALTQLTLADKDLMKNQSPGKPNWSRQQTILPTAVIGNAFSHTLTKDIDFWDPEGDTVTQLTTVSTDDVPSWLTIKETSSGVWMLGGTPTDAVAKDYTFRLRIKDASGGTNRWVTLSVIENAMKIQIKATSNTNYGVGSKATMISDIQTATDGLATYKVSFQVTPTTGKAIISGSSSGSSTTNSWGVGVGSDATNDDLFNGTDSEWVKYISNIQIVDFNANGGALNVNDITTTFESINIVNAQSSNDFVSFKSGSVINNYGKLASSAETVDLKTVLGVSDITNFSVGAGNTSDTNKWSVEGINVKVKFNASTSKKTTEKKVLNDVAVGGSILFPNPAVDYISFSQPVKNIQVFDITGKMIHQNTEETVQLKISFLASGTYILKAVTLEGKAITEKLIKKNY